MASLAKLAVRMVRLTVRMAWLTPQQARGAEYDMWRAKRGNGKKNYFPLTINDLAKSIYHSLSLCVTLYHSSGIVKLISYLCVVKLMTTRVQPKLAT